MVEWVSHDWQNNVYVKSLHIFQVNYIQEM